MSRDIFLPLQSCLSPQHPNPVCIVSARKKANRPCFPAVLGDRTQPPVRPLLCISYLAKRTPWLAHPDGFGAAGIPCRFDIPLCFATIVGGGLSFCQGRREPFLRVANFAQQSEHIRIYSFTNSFVSGLQRGILWSSATISRNLAKLLKCYFCQQITGSAGEMGRFVHESTSYAFRIALLEEEFAQPDVSSIDHAKSRR